MSDKYTSWGNFLTSYLKPSTKKVEKKTVNTKYSDFEKAYFNSKHEETTKKAEVSDEEYQEEVKLVQQYLPEVDEPTVEETEIDELPENYNGEQTVDEMLEEMDQAKLIAINALQAQRMIASIQKDVTKIINDEYQEKETDLTPEEIAEFARLNGIEVVSDTISEDGKTEQIEVNVKKEVPMKEVPLKVAPVEQPTETKVKSVKISKPKEEKSVVKKEKVTKTVVKKVEKPVVETNTAPVKAVKTPKAPKPTRPKTKK